MKSRRFLLLSLGLMVVFYTAYYYPYPEGSAVDEALDAYLRWQARCAGALIGLFDDHARVVDRSVRGRFAISIVKSCSSLDVQALAASAVLAFPARVRDKVIGLGTCLALLTFANWVRIAGLYFVGLYTPARFDMIHEELFPLLLIALSCGAFFLWTRWAVGHVASDA